MADNTLHRMLCKLFFQSHLDEFRMDIRYNCLTLCYFVWSLRDKQYMKFVLFHSGTGRWGNVYTAIVRRCVDMFLPDNFYMKSVPYYFDNDQVNIAYSLLAQKPLDRIQDYKCYIPSCSFHFDIVLVYTLYRSSDLLYFEKNPVSMSDRMFVLNHSDIVRQDMVCKMIGQHQIV